MLAIRRTGHIWSTKATIASVSVGGPRNIIHTAKATDVNSKSDRSGGATTGEDPAAGASVAKPPPVLRLPPATQQPVELASSSPASASRSTLPPASIMPNCPQQQDAIADNDQQPPSTFQYRRPQPVVPRGAHGAHQQQPTGPTARELVMSSNEMAIARENLAVAKEYFWMGVLHATRLLNHLIAFVQINGPTFVRAVREHARKAADWARTATQDVREHFRQHGPEYQRQAQEAGEVAVRWSRQFAQGCVQFGRECREQWQLSQQHPSASAGSGGAGGGGAQQQQQPPKTKKPSCD